MNKFNFDDKNTHTYNCRESGKFFGIFFYCQYKFEIEFDLLPKKEMKIVRKSFSVGNFLLR